MTPDERNAIMEANPPEVCGLSTANTFFSWSWKGCGFGQLHVFLSNDGALIINNERMDRDRVRKILHAWADYVADRAVLQDNPDDVPLIDIKAEREAELLAEEEYMKNNGLI